jgi:hypothetical protein
MKSARARTERFIVDRTAGRLARWLRILGLDVEYLSTCDPSTIAKRTRQSGKIAITRNRDLAARLKESSMLLRSEHLRDQIEQVLQAVGPQNCEPFSRCNICNARLEPVRKELVRGRVPAYVYSHHDKFSVCPVCGRYYWKGTHWDSMAREIENIVGGGRNGSR